MRTLLLLAFLVNGLVPSSELAELDVHSVVDVQPPRLVEAAHGLGHQGNERDHGAAADPCECCSSEHEMAAELVAQAPRLATFGRLHGAGADPHTDDHSRLLFRPPAS